MLHALLDKVDEYIFIFNRFIHRFSSEMLSIIFHSFSYHLDKVDVINEFSMNLDTLMNIFEK
jgi:hypothetical protein